MQTGSTAKLVRVATSAILIAGCMQPVVACAQISGDRDPVCVYELVGDPEVVEAQLIEYARRHAMETDVRPQHFPPTLVIGVRNSEVEFVALNSFGPMSFTVGVYERRTGSGLSECARLEQSLSEAGLVMTNVSRSQSSSLVR